MSSFYGNVKSIIRSPFIFDRIYTSRVEMEDTLYKVDDDTGKLIGDGVFINRYVLINYAYNPDGKFIKIPRELVGQADTFLVNEKNYKNFYYYDTSDNLYKDNIQVGFSNLFQNGQLTIDFYYHSNLTHRLKDNTSLDSNITLIQDDYNNNRAKDAKQFGADYDLTVWMKLYSNNRESYICVGHLDADTPNLELIINAPIDGDVNGSPFFDAIESTSSKYALNMPKNWNVKINDSPGAIYIPEEPGPTLKADYPYSYSLDHEYPYLNKEGFNELFRVRSNEPNEINIVNDYSGTKYPSFEYIPVEVTEDDYRRNIYYVLYFVPIDSLAKFNPATKYYAKAKLAKVQFLSIPDSLVGYSVKSTNKIEFNLCVASDEYDSSKEYYYPTNKDQYILFVNVTKEIYNDSDKSKIYVAGNKNVGYVLSGDENYNPNEIYYVKSKYKEITFSDSKPYKRDTYYIYNSNTFILALDDNKQENTTYYELLDDYLFVLPYTEISYEPNKYYIESIDNQYKISNEEYDSTVLYFIKTVKNAQDIIKEDTKRIDINLPIIGNTICDVYDVIYGSPFILIGYTNQNAEDFSLWTYEHNYRNNEDFDPKYKIGNINGINKVITADFFEDNTKFLQKKSNDYPDINIPIYKIRNLNDEEKRPYTREDLLNILLNEVHPYNTLKESDPISVAWALSELKIYINELRELTGEHGHGLLSDWNLEDALGFGYINRKPRILWTSNNEDNVILDIIEVDPNNQMTPEEIELKQTKIHNDYTLHNIQYIYNHYDENISTLFGVRTDIGVDVHES